MRTAPVVRLLAVWLALGLISAAAPASRAATPSATRAAPHVQRSPWSGPSPRLSAIIDTFIWGPYDFESGWQGWTDHDFTAPESTYGHILDLATIPGGQGDDSLFVAPSLWLGTQQVLGGCGGAVGYSGYQNNQKQYAWKSFTVAAGDSLFYNVRQNSEAGHDFTYVVVSRSGPPLPAPDGGYVLPPISAGDTLATYSGYVELAEQFSLTAKYSNQTITVIIIFNSDGTCSSADNCIEATGGGTAIDLANVSSTKSPKLLTSFAAVICTQMVNSPDGWNCAHGEGLGLFAKLEALSSLPSLDPCTSTCGLSGNVVTIYDGSEPNSHAVGQNEAIVSPVFNLADNPAYPLCSYHLQFDVYANLPPSQGNFYVWKVRYSPVELPDCSCLDPSAWSEWADEGTTYAGINNTLCSTATRVDLSARIPGHATRVQVALGVVNYPFQTTAPGGNQSPYFDNISLRAVPLSAPAMVMAPWDYLQDAYPNAATFATAKSVPAKIDSGMNLGNFVVPANTRMGDSSACSVALSCTAGEKVEVDYLFKITPGPCLNTAHPWWTAYVAQPKIASGPYTGFAVARADTAARGGGTVAQVPNRVARFVSQFHESSPAAGTTYATFGNWSAYTGGVGGSRMFPDDLFTPGTHIEWVQHSTYIPVKANGDNYLPNGTYGNGDGDRLGDQMGNQKWLGSGGTYDPSATFVEETEVLPLTTQDGNTAGCASAQPAHCFLYVDKTDQSGAQFALENAFRNLQISWDRYDVRASASGMGNSLGSRYSAYNYANGDHASGPLPALLNSTYKAILWNTGVSNLSNFSYGATSLGSDAGSDVGLLDGWVRTTTDGKYLWVSGDGAARFLNKTGPRLSFLNTTLGTTFIGIQYRDKNPTWGVTLTGLGPDCTTGLRYGLRANWCPQRRSYNYLGKYTGAGLTGVNARNYKYPDAASLTWYASVQNVASTGGFNFRTQVDGWSLDQLRQDSVTVGNENITAIANWSAVSLSSCFAGCFTSLLLSDVGGSVPAAAVTQLGLPKRNPTTSGAGSISYSLATRTHVALRLFDVAGRVVATLVNGMEDAGPHEARWIAGQLRPGVYFYQMETTGYRSTRRLVLVR